MTNFVSPFHRETISFAQGVVVFAELGQLHIFTARIPAEPGDEEPIHALRTGAWSRQEAQRIFHTLHLNQLLADYNMEVY